MGEDVGRRDCFEQAKADHLRGHPWAQHGLGVQRSKAEISSPICWGAKKYFGAVCQRDVRFFIAYIKTIFRGMADDGVILQLRSICWVGLRCDIILDFRDGCIIRGRD